MQTDLNTYPGSLEAKNVLEKICEAYEVQLGELIYWEGTDD